MSGTPEALTDPPEMQDAAGGQPVLEMLRGMRLSGGIFLEARFTAPWCIAAQVTAEDCAPLLPPPGQIVAYHYVAAGRLLLKAGDHPPTPVERGEIVVLPRNDRHIIGSTLEGRPVSADPLIRPSPGGGLAQIVHGGGGEPTHLYCGFLASDLPQSPVIAMLPAVLKLSLGDTAAGTWIESSLAFAAGELASDRPASPAFLARLAELLFVEAVHRHLAAAPPQGKTWSGGMHDPPVARALALLHRQIARRWTTEALAAEVGLSRSAFAERFTRTVGEPPMRYLTQQRLLQASLLLRESGESIARIAYRVGYDSEAAFTRAFKRGYGAPPAAWRRGPPPAIDTAGA